MDSAALYSESPEGTDETRGLDLCSVDSYCQLSLWRGSRSLCSPRQSSERAGTLISRQLCGMRGKRRKDIPFLWPVPALFQSDTAVPHLGQAHPGQGAPRRRCLCGLASCFSPALGLFPRLSLTSRAPPYPDSWPARLSERAVSSDVPCCHDIAFPRGPHGLSPSPRLPLSTPLLSLVSTTLPIQGALPSPRLV